MKASPTPTPASERQAARLAALVLAAGVSSALHIGKLPVAIPLLKTGLGLSLLQAGFLLSLVQLAGMLLGLVVGLAADRLGPRRVMLVGLLLLALGSALGALAPGVEALLWTRALEGLGFLLAVLPAPALLRQRVAHPPTLSRALGWWGAYMPFGTALALLLGAPLMALMDWRGVWWLLSVMSLLAAVVLWQRVPRDEPSTGAGQGGALPLGPRLQRTLTTRGPWLVALAFFLYSGQWLAVVGFLPTIYSQAGVGGLLLGALTALAAGINMLGNIGAGRWLARGTRPGVLLTIGYLAMGLGALVAFGAEGHPVWQYLAVLSFSGFGGLIPGTLFGLAVVLAPGQDSVSTTVGWMQQWSSLGQFVGPPVVAWVATLVGGWQWTWAITGACSLLGLWLASQLQQAWMRQKAMRDAGG